MILPRDYLFSWNWYDFFMEIAKLRAARTLWSKTVKKYNPKNPKSLLLRTHCQTSGYSLLKNNRTVILSALILKSCSILGGTRATHKLFDEAIALPTDFSAQIARNTQLILQKETDITKTVDLLAEATLWNH